MSESHFVTSGVKTLNMNQAWNKNRSVTALLNLKIPQISTWNKDDPIYETDLMKIQWSI